MFVTTVLVRLVTTIPTLLKNAYVRLCQWKLTCTHILLPFIALDPEEVYQYEATVLEGCDPERNDEYRMIIAAETKAMSSEFFSNSESSE